MAAVNSTQGSKVDKLRMVVKKGNLIITMLEKKGIDAGDQKMKISEAKDYLDQGRIELAYRTAIDCISELKKMQNFENKTPKGNRGKGVFALIRDNNTDMENKISEWKVITSGWRKKGYKFEDDRNLFSKSFDQIEKSFISIGEQIEKAEQIRGQISRIREDFSHVGKGYLKKIDDIERAVFRLDRLDDIERRLKTVAGTISSVEGRYRSLRNMINRFKRKGLSTASLEEMLENDEDLDYLDKQFKTYQSNVEFLQKEKEKLRALKGELSDERFQKKVADLESIVNDPWKLDLIVEKMLDLERGIKESKEKNKKQKEEEKRRRDIRRSLEKYSDEGFKVDMVKQLLDEDINLLEEEYDIFIRQTARLRTLKEKLFKLDATGFEEDVSRISKKLHDPTNLEQIEDELNTLKNNILSQRIRSQKIENAIKEWSGMGFKVNKLETLLKNDIDEAENLFETYSRRIAELIDFEARIKEIKQKDFQDQIHRIKLKMKNPDLIESTRKEMERLLAKVSETENIRAKRSELNNLLKAWRSQGYKIDRILEDTQKENTIQGLERVILDHTRAIATLESFRNEFPSYERGWLPDLEHKIKEQMNDPMMAKDTLKKFTRLKSLLSKEERKRGEISRKLDQLSSRNIEISRIKDFLTGDAVLLDQEYASFKDKVKRLLKLKADLLRKAGATGDQKKEMLAKGLNDPYQIEIYERQILREAEPIDPEELNKIKDKAKELYREDKLEKALDLFNNILDIDPENKESLFYKKKVTQKMKSVMTDTDSQKEEKAIKEIPKNEVPIETETADSGSGGDPDCLSCKGTGRCVWCEGKGVCSTCHGTGNTFGDECPTCHGEGKCSVCNGSGKCAWCNN